VLAAQAAAVQPIDAAGDPAVLYFETLPELAALAETHAIDGSQAGSSSGAVSGVAGKPRSSARQLNFDAYGRRFDVLLETNDRLSGALPSKSSASSLVLYRGVLEGNSRSWVRLATKGGKVHGMIWDGTDLYVIEPAAAIDLAGATGAAPADADRTLGSAADDRRADAGAVIFRLADVLIEPDTATCAAPPGKTLEADTSADGADSSDAAPADADTARDMRRGDAAYGALLQELKGFAAIMQAAGATRRLTLSILGDTQFLQRYASAQDAQDAIMIRLNHVDGIYSAQLGVELRVDALFVEDQLSRSFSNTTVPNSLLSELAKLRARSTALRSRGLTHLFTGRDLDGPTAGIAYMDALCDTQYGAALTQARGSWRDALVAAHEIGHNFGAPHDGEGACTGAPPDYLMASAVSGSETFSQCSLEQMRPRAQAAHCITALPPANAAVARDLGTTRHPVTLPFDWQLDIRNEGGLTAHDVHAELIVPPAMIIEDASVMGGSCTSGAGVVQCLLGDLPGGASHQIDLRLYSDSIGTHSVAANVSAANDAHSFDNRGDGSIQIDSNTSSSSVQVDNGSRGGGGSMGASMLLGLAALRALRSRRRC